jgi:hypothetical protein
MVRAAHSRAAEAGGSLDAKLKDLEAASAPYGGELEGLKYSVKGLGSLRRKVASDVSDGADAAGVIADTRDLNRYTICFPAESYSDGVAAGFDRLQELGLEPYNPEKTHKNTWNDPSYKGINTSWQDQDTGQFVEIQFHTPESFQVKSDNHALYELSRSGSLESDEELAADWLQAQRYEDVEIPQGHDSTVPAKPSRELAAVEPEALEQVRAKEAELKQSQARESPAAEEPESDPPRETQADPVQDARDDVSDGQSASAAYDDYEDHQMARIAAAKGVPESDGSRSGDADDVASAESAQDAAGERPETGESEDGFPQPVDEGVADGPEADAVPEGRGSGEADTDGQDAGQTDRAEDAQGQDATASATEQQQESGDDYGETSTANREREGIGD